MRHIELGVAAMTVASTLVIGCGAGSGSGRPPEPRGMTDCTVRTALALTESKNAWLSGQPAGLPDIDFVGQYGLADASVLAYIRLNPKWIAALDARLGTPFAATDRFMRDRVARRMPDPSPAVFASAATSVAASRLSRSELP